MNHAEFTWVIGTLPTWVGVGLVSVLIWIARQSLLRLERLEERANCLDQQAAVIEERQRGLDKHMTELKQIQKDTMHELRELYRKISI